MKKIFGSTLSALAFIMLISVSCKSKVKDVPPADTVVVAPAATDNTIPTVDSTVVINGNDSLKNMLVDAVKDFPGVSTSVDNGVVTLSGNISRSKLPQLMKSVNAIHPKKVVNQLTIK